MIAKSLFFQLLTVCCISTQTFAQLDQDPESLYLKNTEPLILKTNSATAVYGTKNLVPHLKTFPEGDTVQVIAIHPKAFLIKHTQTGYEGWIEPRSVPELDPQLLEKFKNLAEEEKLFAKAIKDEEVLPGMTFEHVERALGKPHNKTFRTDEKGRFDVWSYVDFLRQTEFRQTIDPSTQRVLNIPVTVKIPIGSLNVEFKNGRVSAVEKTQDTTKRSKPRY
jgi:hypothetical protein